MSESTPHNLEKEKSPEMLAIEQLDASASRIFAENEVRPDIPNPYDPAPEGSVVEIVSDGKTGDSVIRTTLADGSVSYKHVSLWYASPDRGSFESEWRRGGNEMTNLTNGEISGKTPAKPATPEQISQLKNRLDSVFAAKAETSAASKSGRMRRMFGRLTIGGKG